MEAGPVEGFDVSVIGTNDYADTADSDVIVVTAGIARKPGMSRDDLLRTNYNVVSSVVEQCVRYSPNAYLIIVTNPVDVMTYAAWKVSGWPTHRVMGMAGVLDSTRFRTFLAMELGVSVEDISAFVMGGHGDTMVPFVRYSHAGGIPIEKLLPKERSTRSWSARARRRRNRQPAQDRQRLLRSRRLGRANGRGDTQGQETTHPRHRLPGRRVRREGHLRRRARHPRCGRRGKSRSKST